MGGGAGKVFSPSSPRMDMSGGKVLAMQAYAQCVCVQMSVHILIMRISLRRAGKLRIAPSQTTIHSSFLTILFSVLGRAQPNPKTQSSKKGTRTL